MPENRMPENRMPENRMPEDRMPKDYIKLDQFLKITEVAQSGGEAKQIIRSGEVSVNGEMEIRRGRKLYDNDVVTVDETSFTVHLSAGSSSG